MRSTTLVILSIALLAQGCGSGPVGSLAANSSADLSAQAAQVPQQLMTALDRQGKGYLTQADVAGFMSPADFARADTNHDGRLTSDELSAFLATYGAQGASGGISAQSVLIPGIIGAGILGVVGAGYLVYGGLEGAHQVEWPTLDKTPTTPAQLGLPFRDVTISDGDPKDQQNLAGWYIPAAVPTDKCVIFQHGQGGSKGQWLAQFVPWLHARYNVLTFDFRGDGQNPPAPCSLGYYETEEMLAAIQVAKAQGNASIGLMGLSMGAAAAIDAAAEDPEVKAVVEDCAFADWYHAFYPRIVKKGYPLAGILAKVIEKVVDMQLGIDGEKAAPINHLAQLGNRPLFIIHGAADDETTPDNAQMIYDAYSGPKQLWLVPGAKHAQSHAVAGAEYERRVMAFWAQSL